MKKILAIAAPLVLIIASVNAQEEPPPPPPKAITIIDEKVKYKIVEDKVVKEPPVITVKGKIADDFYKRNPTVAEISRQGNIITLKKKDGTEEKYDLSKKEEEENFNDKYGASPIPPPPPPPKKIDLKEKRS